MQIHPSTKKLIDRLYDMTLERRIAWKQGTDGAVVYDTERYRVTLVGNPTEVILSSDAGTELDKADHEELKNTQLEDGTTYAEYVGQLHKEAHRIARGAESAIDDVLAELEQSEKIDEPKPALPVPAALPADNKLEMPERSDSAEEAISEPAVEELSSERVADAVANMAKTVNSEERAAAELEEKAEPISSPEETSEVKVEKDAQLAQPESKSEEVPAPEEPSQTEQVAEPALEPVEPPRPNEDAFPSPEVPQPPMPVDLEPKLETDPPPPVPAELPQQASETEQKVEPEEPATPIVPDPASAPEPAPVQPRPQITGSGFGFGSLGQPIATNSPAQPAQPDTPVETAKEPEENASSVEESDPSAPPVPPLPGADVKPEESNPAPSATEDSATVEKPESKPAPSPTVLTGGYMPSPFGMMTQRGPAQPPIQPEPPAPAQAETEAVSDPAPPVPSVPPVPSPDKGDVALAARAPHADAPATPPVPQLPDTVAAVEESKIANLVGAITETIDDDPEPEKEELTIVAPASVDVPSAVSSIASAASPAIKKPEPVETQSDEEALKERSIGIIDEAGEVIRKETEADGNGASPDPEADPPEPPKPPSKRFNPWR